jgi:hypothetical protein
MKPLMLIGAILGFLLGVVLGMRGQGDWSSILWRSMLGALLLGLLMRWWGQRWLHCLREAQQQRLAALVAERKEARNSPAKKV